MSQTHERRPPGRRAPLAENSSLLNGSADLPDLTTADRSASRSRCGACSVEGRRRRVVVGAVLHAADCRRAGYSTADVRAGDLLAAVLR